MITDIINVLIINADSKDYSWESYKIYELWILLISLKISMANISLL